VPKIGTVAQCFDLLPPFPLSSFGTRQARKHWCIRQPGSLITNLAQFISFLSTSLEDLTVLCGREEGETLKDAISAFVCQCGSSLRNFCSEVPLSEAAIHRIMQLPNSRSWIAVQGPPQTVPLSGFPPLETVYLFGQAALPWLHLFASP